MNEVETVARVGERAGAALSSGVQTARQRAKTARKNAKRARKELAKRLPDQTARLSENARKAREAALAAQAALADRTSQAQEVLAERWVPAARDALAEGWDVAQEVFAERMQDARKELAARIDPAPRRRRRWPWLLLLGVAATGAVGAVVLTRRPREVEPEPFLPPTREPGAPTSEPDPAWGASAGNGAVAVERPSASTD